MAANTKKKKRVKIKMPPHSMEPVDAIPVPDYIPPEPEVGETLLEILKTRRLEDEREFLGEKLSGRALHNLTPQEIRDLRDVFKAFDFENKGVIGATEVYRAMRALGFRLTREEVWSTINEMSVAASNGVDFNEFLEIIIDSQGDSKDILDEILQGFALFDYDHTGRIGVDCLRRASREAGLSFSDTELMDMIREADASGNGEIDLEEFTAIMLKTNLF